MAMSPQFWEEAIPQIEKRLIAYLCRYVGPADAIDIAQKTYLAIFQKSTGNAPTLKLQTTNDFQRYAFNVAHNFAVSFLRSKGVRREQSLGQTDDDKTWEPAEREVCDDELVKLERIQALRDCMGQLNQEMKYTAFLREFLAGKSYSEIAAEFKVSSDTVGSALSVGRKKLKSCIDSKLNLAG